MQVVISNDNSGVESTVNQFVTDYNSLISAVNAQEGNTSSGTPEPLFGSPTLSLLQQELLNGLNTQNPNGYLDPVSAAAGVTLSGSMTIQVGSGVTETVQIGAEPAGGGNSNTIYTGSGTGYNTLSGLVDAINAANTTTPISYTAASGGDSGTMTASNSASLSGTLTLQAGSGAAETIYLGTATDAPSGDLATGTLNNSISSLESFINGNSTLSGLGITASIVDNGDGTSTMTLASSSGALTASSSVEIPSLGVVAGVTTSSGESTLTLTSQIAGSSGGALTVTSALDSVAPTPVTFTDTGYTSTSGDYGTLGSVANANDTLSGTLSIQVGSGTAQTITLDSSDDTLSGLMGAINGLSGVSAALNQAGTGLIVTSGTDGADGALTITSNIVDTSSPTSTELSYNTSSDINSLTALGISVNDDGSLTFDASSLDSVLNTDYSSVVGFFQNSESWGLTFSNMLTNAGSSSSTGILALAGSANSTTESTLNAEISKENSYISSQQSSLTTELNSANEVLEELPTQLQGINELYSAITGYNEDTST